MPKAPQIHSILTALLLLATAYAYIDITLDIASSSSDIAFNLPLTLAAIKCPVALSLQNKEEFIVMPKHKGKAGSKKLEGELKVSSL